MVREWATKETVDKLEQALTPPPGWRDPFSGLPAGWGDEDDDWAAFEEARR